ncbi:MAG: insulinase family protein [Chloroflexi bacterium]|nr:insulinase family protein [Chloroflexota bacterium]
MNDTLITYTLENGLTLLIREIHTAPIVSSWVWYGIGSRNEVPGKTGLSHWVEHMQFKGTAQHSASWMDHSIARLGGHWNAFTSPDWTTYFETLPASALETALELEADRMRGSLFEPNEVETERTVILSEREGLENDPLFQLNEAVQLRAFREHPYRNEVIGAKEDLLALTREDLYGHYRNYYQPANALLCLAGDIDPQQALALTRQYFGNIESLPLEKQLPAPEENPPAFEQVDLHGPGDATFVEVAWRAPKGNSEDFFAFTILESLLTGPSSLNMFGGGGISNRTSRLYLALVEKELAVGVNGSLNASIDPGTFTINLTKHPARSVSTLLSALDNEIEKIQSKPVTQAEINRAVKQAKALFAYSSDNITNHGFWMGYANSFADYSWFTGYVERLAAVTPEMVTNTARKYLRPDARVIGVYTPNGAEAGND